MENDLCLLCEEEDLEMVCEQSAESFMSKELMLCPPKSSNLPQIPIESPAGLLNVTLPPLNHPTLKLTFQPPPVLQAQVPTQALFESPCLRKRPNDRSPLVEPQATVTFTEQGEMRVRHMYNTSLDTCFTSITAPLLPQQPASGETSTHALPSISSDAPLMPPKEETHTFYSTDQLVELESVFQDVYYPNEDKRKEIPAALGVTPHRNKKWFQNHHAKWMRTAKNTLPPCSTILTSCTSPPACVDVGPSVSQRGFLEYMPPPMHNPPPIRRASLPLITTYNPPSHIVSPLLDTPEHSEACSSDTMPLALQSDPGFDYDGLSLSRMLDYMTSAPPDNYLHFQLDTFPQQSNTLLTQQTNCIIPQQNINAPLMPPKKETCTLYSTACVDVGPSVSQRGSLEYMPPPMHNPPPIRRASLPLITTYNPPSHTVSPLLDRPEHSEASSSDTMPLCLQSYPGMSTQWRKTRGPNIELPDQKKIKLERRSLKARHALRKKKVLIMKINVKLRTCVKKVKNI